MPGATDALSGSGAFHAPEFRQAELEEPDCIGLAAPPAGFEPAHPAPEAGALSPELRGRGHRIPVVPPAPSGR